jgi:hypothetical protein
MISAGIFEQAMGARNRAGNGLSYRPARIHRLKESILELHKTSKIPAQLGNSVVVAREGARPVPTHLQKSWAL